MGLPSARARTRIGIAGAVIVVLFVAFWIVGQEVSSDPTIDPGGLAAALYPGSWSPVPRGIAWLVAGAAAVAFDLFIMVPSAVTGRGRVAARVFAVLTGACFLIFAIGTFLQTDWSIIH